MRKLVRMNADKQGDYSIQQYFVYMFRTLPMCTVGWTFRFYSPITRRKIDMLPFSLRFFFFFKIVSTDNNKQRKLEATFFLPFWEVVHALTISTFSECQHQR